MSSSNVLRLHKGAFSPVNSVRHKTDVISAEFEEKKNPFRYVRVAPRWVHKKKLKVAN